MRVNLEFEFYPDFNLESLGSVFIIHHPKIELKKEKFEETLKIFFKEKFNYNESHTFIDFHQFRNRIYVEFYIDIYNEISNKEELDEILGNFICNIIDDLGIGMYNRKGIIYDKIKLRLEFHNGAFFYNTYEYKLEKEYVWLILKDNIGQFNGKMIRYNKYLKLKE